MKNRRIPVVIGILAAAFIAFCLYAVSSLFLIHSAIIGGARTYQPQTIASYDQKYIIQTERTEDETGVYASFHVIAADTEELLFNCDERYRTMDLKGIYWGDQTYDIIVDSSDVGMIIYAFQDGSWEKQSSGVSAYGISSNYLSRKPLGRSNEWCGDGKNQKFHVKRRLS